ncbi:MAG: hypothetical protein JSW46_14290 [Gemmatimonadota bacterium]|nr:MAG: hypothetical protein JSW46_14290 [Gemmatimonadota bacterium]
MDIRERAADVLCGLGIAALTAVLAACAGGSGSPKAHEWRASYDTIGDTLVVRTESGSVWGDTAMLVADLTIGQFEGPDEYLFGRVRSLAVASDGSIYTYDEHVKELRKYAADGTYVATFGRRGGGPGEYEEPDGGLAILPDGRIVLRDPANARLSVFSPQGEYLDGWRSRGGLHTSRRLYKDTAGSVYTLLLLNLEGGIDDWTTALVRYGPDGAPGDTLDPPTYAYETPEIRASDEEGDHLLSSWIPFTPRDSWAFSPLGYFVAGVSSSYTIDLHIAPDRVLRIERADWQPVPVKPEERAEQERIETAGMRQLDPGWRWNGPPIPDTKPPYERFFVGEDGRIWVQLYQEAHKIETAEDYAGEDEPGQIPEPTWIESVAFDVFEPDGRYLGMVRAPDGLATYPTPVARGDTLWAVVEDELDVPYIVRFIIGHAAGTSS